MMWYRDRKSGETFSERVTRESHHGAADPPKTTRDPYPLLDSVAKDEAIFRLKKQYELLEKRVADLEKNA